MKRYTIVLALLLSTALTACFEERDEGYEFVGFVATIPMLSIAGDAPRLPGNNVTVNFRYYAENIDVVALRLLDSNEGTVASREVSGHNREDSYEDAFEYTIPSDAELGSSIVLTLEVETSNNLVNSRTVTLQVETPAEGEEG